MNDFIISLCLLLVFNCISFLFVNFALDFEKLVNKYVERKDKK